MAVLGLPSLVYTATFPLNLLTNIYICLCALEYIYIYICIYIVKDVSNESNNNDDSQLRRPSWYRECDVDGPLYKCMLRHCLVIY